MNIENGQFQEPEFNLGNFEQELEKIDRAEMILKAKVVVRQFLSYEGEDSTGLLGFLVTNSIQMIDGGGKEAAAGVWNLRNICKHLVGRFGKSGGELVNCCNRLLEILPDVKIADLNPDPQLEHRDRALFQRLIDRLRMHSGERLDLFPYIYGMNGDKLAASGNPSRAKDNEPEGRSSL